MIHWLQIFEHDGTPSTSRSLGLYRRETPTDGTPEVGDAIQLGDDMSPTNIKRRYWDDQGRLNVEYRDICWLPNERGELWIEQGFRRSVGREPWDEARWFYPDPWRQNDEDGEEGGLLGLLERQGWVKQ